VRTALRALRRLDHFRIMPVVMDSSTIHYILILTLLWPLEKTIIVRLEGGHHRCSVCQAEGSWQVRLCQPGPGIVAAKQSSMGRKGMPTRKKKAVLLVDDEPIILSSLSRELAKNAPDLDVTLEVSGESAIAGINKSCFDLVVTDLVMPGLDGFSVLKAAKMRDAQTMVIILTGFADMKSTIEALRLGADDFLQKPCDVEELLFRMESCFAKQDLLRKVTMYENFLPICSYCKKIRADPPGEFGSGQWYSLEEFFSKVKEVHCSHGCCPDCFARLLPDINEENTRSD
jgi:CheY-like chemotaxis protein